MDWGAVYYSRPGLGFWLSLLLVKAGDASMGDGTVLSMVLRDLHRRWPTSPFFVVGKEISREDMRINTGKLADRFAAVYVAQIKDERLNKAMSQSPISRRPKVFSANTAGCGSAINVSLFHVIANSERKSNLIGLT